MLQLIYQPCNHRQNSLCIHVLPGPFHHHQRRPVGTTGHIWHVSLSTWSRPCVSYAQIRRPFLRPQHLRRHRGETLPPRSSVGSRSENSCCVVTLTPRGSLRPHLSKATVTRLLRETPHGREPALSEQVPVRTRRCLAEGLPCALRTVSSARASLHTPTAL